MSVQDNLSDLFSALKARLKKDRLIGLENVYTLLQQDRVAAYLTEGSKNGKDGLSWDILFTTVHSTIMTEVERGAVVAKHLEYMNSALITVISKARAKIKTNTLVCAVLAVFSSQEVSAVIGKIYFELTSGYLFQHPKYRAEMKCEHWDDLVKMCQQQYRRPHTGGSSLKFLELLRKIVAYGVHYSLPPSSVLSLLPFCTSIVMSELPPSANFEYNFVHLVNTTIEALASDYRYEVVEFIENVLEAIIGMYKTGKDINSHIFTFCCLAVNTHHPQGVGPENDLAYAVDWNRWKSQLADIRKICDMEINEILRSGEKTKFFDEFLLFIVDVFHITYLMKPASDESSLEEEKPDSPATCTGRKRKSIDVMTQTQKRTKLLSSRTSISGILCEMTPRDQWFWLIYLEILILRYPEDLKVDFQQVVQLVCNMLCDMRGSPSSVQLSRCAVSLLENFPQDFHLENLKALEPFWLKVGESLIRSVAKDNSTDHHHVLQALVRNGIIKNVTPLLNLYTDEQLTVCSGSLDTLSEILMIGAMKDEKQRCDLLKWCLDDTIIPENTTKLVVSLITKQFTFRTEKLMVKKPRYLEIYNAISLGQELSSENVENNASNTDVQLNNKVASRLVEILKEKLDVILCQAQSQDIYEMCKAAYYLEIILQTLSVIWSTNNNTKIELLFITKVLFSNLTSTVAEMLEYKKGFPLTVIARLFGLDLNSELQTTLRDPSFTRPQLIEKALELFQNLKKRKADDKIVFENVRIEDLPIYTSPFIKNMAILFDSGNKDFKNMFGREIFVKKQGTIMLDVTEFLCQFVQSPSTLNDMQTNTASQLLSAIKDGSLKITSPLQLPLILRIIYMLVDSLDLDLEFVSECLDCLTLICQSRFDETSILTVALLILNSLIPVIGKYGTSSSVEMFQKVMEGFRLVLEKRNYTMDIMVLQYLKALTISNSYPILEDCCISNDIRLVDDVIKFLKHPSAKVRLAAAREIDAVFNCTSSSPLNALTNMQEILFQIPEMSNKYRRQAYAASSLIAVAKAFKTAQSIRHRVAFLMLQYMSMQHCDDTLIENFLNFISSLLGVPNVSKYFSMHLKDLLTEWLRKGNTLSQFPYQLLQLNNFKAFCKKYLDIVGAVCIMTENDDVLSEIAHQLDITTVQIIEEAYSIAKPLISQEKNNMLTQMLSVEREEEIQTLRLHEIGYAVLRESNSASSLEVPGCQKLFGYLIEKSCSVQQLLLLLEEDIVESVVDEDITESLKKYDWFVQKYIECANNININCYVLRDAISVSLRILLEKHSYVRMKMCCNLINSVINAYITCLKSEIILLLPGISNCLVSVIMQYRKEASPALDLLRYLVVEKKTELFEGISRLDPFPDEEDFKELINKKEEVDLYEEMTRFTRVVGYKGRRIAGLTRLLHGLEIRKSELVSIYDKAQAVNPTPEQRLLNKVILQLVQLCSHKDEAVKMEAAKCLGELGASDLSTLVFKIEESAGSEYIAPELRLVDQATNVLGQLIQTEGLPVKRAACRALYAVMRCDGAISQLSNFYSPFFTPVSSELKLEAKSAFGPPSTVWMPIEQTSHEDWVVTLTVALLDTLFDHRDVCINLAEVCRVHAAFASEILPVVFEIVLTEGTRSLVFDVTRNVNSLLSNHIHGSTTIPRKSINLLVETIDYARKWTWRSGNYNFRSFFNVDLLLLAEAAESCAAHFTSMFYSEAWFEEQKCIAYEKTPSLWNWSIDQVPERGETLSRIMRTAYANVGIHDGLLGCGSSHFADYDQRLAHFEQLGKWQLALPLHDAMQNTKGIALSLHNLHYMNTLSHIPLDSQAQISCALRLGDWSYLVPYETPSSFNLHHYNSLKAFHDNDNTAALFEINKATNVVLQSINDNQVESCRELSQSLSRLQCLKQLQDVVNLKSYKEITNLRTKWTHQDNIKSSDFSLMEEVISSRCVIVKELCSKKYLDMVNVLGEQNLRLCKISRKANRDDVNIRNIVDLSRLEGVEENLLLESKIEEARYYWRKNEHRIGSYLLSQLLKSLEDSSKHDVRAKCLRLYGDWMVNSKAENPKVIIDKYFLKSAELAQAEANKLESYAAIAKFADKNYIQRRDYLESSEFESRQNNINEQTTLVSTCGVQKAANRDQLYAFHIRQKENAIDVAEVGNLISDVSYFLVMALRYYTLSLQCGDKYNHFVFRLLSLWLNNMEISEVSILLNEHLPKVASYKFISLLPQIVPRIHENLLLYETVKRTMLEHPHHTLPFIFALKNSHADQLYTTNKNIKTTTRTNSAVCLLKDGAHSNELTTMINQMDIFTKALIHLANKETERGRSSVTITQDFPIAKIENLNSVLLPSITLPVQQNLQYKNIVGVLKFGKTFQLVGGVNAPKKIECLGTDGITRYLLVKGKDDLRQDAVMQQVFGVINNLLSQNEETRRRKLVMRTYRVVPLSQRSGVIEWCSNTQPIGQYLVGSASSGGAHVKFRPKDLKPSEAKSAMAVNNLVTYLNVKTIVNNRECMMRVINARGGRMAVAKASSQKKLEEFLMVCRKFQPVFHYFFLENFHSTGAFFERRLAYIRSVATSSMIGYILGLGDRHTMNILIDNSTAEVIHIDFGIAFEQGKVLPTPETVPFRLTRDIVDGMGLCGVDGVFRASCERTMDVLRENKDIIVTLLEVLLYDPLYSWSITPAKALSLQNDSATESSSNPISSDSETKVNAMAERALLRVTSKLQGMGQDGVLTSVEGQVNGLIQQAKDHSNLSRLYCGWQAYV